MGVWYRTELRSGPGRESNRPQDEAPQQSSQVANGGLVCRYGDDGWKTYQETLGAGWSGVRVF